MKKLIAILIPSILLAMLVFVGFHYFVQEKSQKGALQVTSSPDSKVYLDDKYIGQTPLCKCEAVDMLSAGEYTIRLTPLEKNLPEFQEKITISEGVLTVVDRTFGKESFSEGSVISLSPLDDKDATELLVVSFPKGAEISLDSNEIGKTPFSYKDPTESDHVLSLSKRGYSDKSIRIRTPKGYKLTVAVYLSPTTELEKEEITVASSSATISPEPSPTPEASVSILDTPTGFLRVRAENSLGSSEVGQVTPGVSYPLLSEESGWFEIEYEEGKRGWISSQYAEKSE